MKMLPEQLNKYRGIVISIIFFLIFDASVLILNFYISFEISSDASAVNIAGRQRMLSQRITKSLLDIEHSSGNSTAVFAAKNELNSTSILFNNTLEAFREGGIVRGADNQPVKIQPASTAVSKQALAQTLRLWAPYLTAIEEVIAMPNDEIDGKILGMAIRLGKESNLQILENMNTLTVELENIASSKATTLRLIQSIGITLAILNFLIIIFHFLKQLRQSDSVIEQAREETNNILKTVNEGLFLIDEQLIIGEQYSKQLEDILGKSNIAKGNLNDMLAEIVSLQDVSATEEYINALFDKKADESIDNLKNPLERVQVNIINKNGYYDNKYLSFQFSRVIENSQTAHLLITVNDISQYMKLESELKLLQQKEEEQLKTLTSILHTHADILQHFIKKSLLTFSNIDNALKQPDHHREAQRKKLQVIFREVHNFKSEALSLSLDIFIDQAQQLEDMISLSITKENPKNVDLLPLNTQLRKMISQVELVEKMMNKINSFSKPKHLINDRRIPLDNLFEELCIRHNKKVTLVTSGLQENNLDNDMIDFINDICIQFMRNAMTHGIEDEDERIAAEKPIIARIDCHLYRRSDNYLEFIFEDDGRGIDYHAIREKAIATKEWSRALVESWDNKKLLSLIFTPGFSTSEAVDYDAGQGLGMDIIKDRVNRNQGKLQISSKKGFGTRFSVTLPYKPALQKSA
jgi:HPt (histidine-containing phosphotransfer) domain-containing protein